MPRVNVAQRMSDWARRMPDAVAVACPGKGDVAGRNHYATCTYRELDDDANALARGLIDMGVGPGDRLTLLVRPGVAFVKLVFALLQSGATTVLVDPGMGIRRVIGCLATTRPAGFIAVSSAQAVCRALSGRFPDARHRVTVGRRWFWGGVTYQQLLRRGRNCSASLPATAADEAAAIIFTSGSTGPPKGVVYTHQMFDAQAQAIQAQYDLQPGGADLSCFPLFGLFNSAMGVTTVFPEMDFARPAACSPQKLLRAAFDWQATQAFASPAVWDKVSRHCESSGELIPSLRKIFSCGAPVPSAVLRRTLTKVAPQAEMHTPYGATEALPVASISAQEVLDETAELTDQGGGVCVGRRYDSIDWRVIDIADQPVNTLDEASILPTGEIGELVVRAPQVSPAYRDDEGANAAAKISDGATIWHRMGDVGYFDEQERFWYCGRKAHRVITREGTLYTIPAEAIVNTRPDVQRSALVGVGPPGAMTPVMVVETTGPVGRRLQRQGEDGAEASRLTAELRELMAQFAATESIHTVLYHRSLPVDVRHNSKINRERLAVWATQELARRRFQSPPNQRSLAAASA